jgi:mono/diheme cytochrome c family protein
VVPLSIMPSYAALFDGSPDEPSQDARDLVAYLETLGRARELAWPEGDAAAQAAAPHDHWAQMAFDTPILNAHPARARARGDMPPLTPAGTDAAAGQALWRDNCAGCHGATGRGDGPAAQWLEPPPTNLAAREYARRRLADALWNGVLGTSMPAWRDRSASELALLADVVAGFAEPVTQTPPVADALALGERVYAEHCIECHGETGAGDGFAAGELPVAPTDFRAQRPTHTEAARVLRDGVAGTSMAPWTDRLGAEELDAVAHYVRAFFDEDAQ